MSISKISLRKRRLRRGFGNCRMRVGQRFESASLVGPARRFFRLASLRPHAASGWERGPERQNPSAGRGIKGSRRLSSEADSRIFSFPQINSQLRRPSAVSCLGEGAEMEFLPTLKARIAEAWCKTWAVRPEGKRGPTVFGGDREGPPAKRPYSFAKDKATERRRDGRNSKMHLFTKRPREARGVCLTMNSSQNKKTRI